MSPYVIVGCGAEKRAGWHPAVNLYVGPLFAARLRYARLLGGPHAILSGLYGLIEDPQRVVPNYDFRLSQRGRDLNSWIETQALRAEHYAAGRPIVLLASGDYARVADACRVPVEVPGRGLPIGKLLREMKRLADNEARAEVQRLRPASPQSQRPDE